MSFFLEHPDTKGVIQFIVFTLILGGGAAFMAGRALAIGWKPLGLLAFYMLLFTAGLRFLDYALFQSNLLSLKYYISHGLVVMGLAWLGYRLTRVSQMVTQYPWLYERSGPFAWKDRPREGAAK
jgi:hypothetical protein